MAIDASLDNVKRKTRQHRASASWHVLDNGAVMRLVDGQMRKMGSVPI